MIVVSRHLMDVNLVPAGAVVRINLAWEPSLEALRQHLSEMTPHVLLDVPSRRTKPPLHEYNLRDLCEVAANHENVRYVAVSNVEGPEDVIAYVVRMPRRVLAVPKIETAAGCKAFADVAAVLHEPKTAMLDHEDLFRDLVSLGRPPDELYTGWIDPLAEFCRLHGVRLLRLAGTVFSDRL